MKKILYIFLTITLFLSLTSSIRSELKYSSVKIFFDKNLTIEKALKNPLILNDALQIHHDHLQTILNSHEIDKLISIDINMEILVDDLEEYYSRKIRKHSESLKKLNITLSGSNFRLGSMGGYYTIEQLYEQLDQMKIKYPNYFRETEIIGYSYEKRPIYAYYFTKENSDEKKEVLYTAAHHAREPGGITTLVYFLWDLLESADAGDPAANYILENRLICAVPLINPDGYYYNQSRLPDGGGLWRKNRRKTGNTVQGVDLNRNYGPKRFWDYSNDGSSTDPESQTYRGKAPFSEPETRAVRDFCKRHDFKVALNYHTYSNIIIHPYGFNGNHTKDSTLFRYMCQDMSVKNRYHFGLTHKSLGYKTRGNSDDWMYYPQDRKSRIMSMTVEVGSRLDGFWCAPHRILEHARENLYLNYQAAWNAGANIRPTDVLVDNSLPNYYVTVIYRNTGVDDLETDAYLSVKSLDSRVVIESKHRLIGDMASATQAEEKFGIIDYQGISNGTEVPVEVKIVQNGVPRRDTFRITLLKNEFIPVFENEEEPGNWDYPQWGLEYSPVRNSYVISDSPNKKYAGYEKNYLTINEPISLDNCANAELEFHTKWSMERIWDVGCVQASSDNGESWQSLSSTRTIEGTGLNGEKLHRYDHRFTGNFPIWIRQVFSLRNYAGKDILLRFGLLSDSKDNYDGWLLDEVRIKKYPDNSQTSAEFSQQKEALGVKISPIPVESGQQLNINIKLREINKSSTINLRIIDVTGRNYFVNIYKIKDLENGKLCIDTEKMLPGIYFLRLKINNTFLNKKLIIH